MDLSFSAPDPKPDGWDLAVAGMEQSYEAARDEWKEAAVNALLRTCRELSEFTIDDVWKRFPDGLETGNGSAIGHIMQQGRKDGWMEATGSHHLGTRPAMHRKPVPVWRSLIYGR